MQLNKKSGVTNLGDRNKIIIKWAKDIFDVSGHCDIPAFDLIICGRSMVERNGVKHLLPVSWPTHPRIYRAFFVKMRS